MSFTDWDTIAGPNNPVLNSSLTNPLPVGAGAGDFCRRLNLDTGTGGVPATTMMVSPSVANGAFVGIPITKTIRAEAYIRRGNNVSSFAGGFFVKWQSVSNQVGYGIVYDAFYQTQPRLYLNDQTQVSLTAVGNLTTTWLSLRMDVFPLGTTGDQIVVSQESSPGSGVWTKISINGGNPDNGYFVDSLTTKYAPWGGTRRCGLSTAGGYAQAGSVLLDRVRFSIAAAPPTP
jgi:hypothetical protein